MVVVVVDVVPLPDYQGFIDTVGAVGMWRKDEVHMSDA